MPQSVRAIAAPRDVNALRRAVLRRTGGFVLESVAPGETYAGFSYYGFGPVRRLDVPHSSDPLLSLTDLRPLLPVEAPFGIPFIGGWVGYLAYEAGGFCEPLAAARRHWVGVPLARWGLYDSVIVHDGAGDRWFVTATDLPDSVLSRERRLDALERFTAELPAEEPVEAEFRPVGGLRGDLSRDEYLDCVRQALDYIAAGDVFQVNLARQLRLPYRGSADALYGRLCHANPARFAACLTYGGDAVISSSPELFLDVRDSRVVTCPIKGTRRRTGDAAIDASLRVELAESEKDLAELAMIVDLERNDLGRVCRYGSVRVDDAGSIEELATVIHRVATVSGALRPGLDCLDALRATFPGGSITGAPKVRAMQIIDELERSPRGPYCGAIGYIGIDGSLMLNLAIRTMVLRAGTVYCSVGGGIVADSDPEQEFEETEAKAAGMLRALGVAKESPAAMVGAAWAGPASARFETVR